MIPYFSKLGSFLSFSEVSGSDSSTTSTTLGQLLPKDQCNYKCEDWKTNKLAVKITMSCTDKKYELSLAKGERYLIFAADVNVFRQGEGNHYDVCAEATAGHCKCEPVCCPACNQATGHKSVIKNCQCADTTECCEGINCAGSTGGGGGGGGGPPAPPPTIPTQPPTTAPPAPPAPAPPPGSIPGPPPPLPLPDPGGPN
jgi:hypothetical protein